MHNFYIPLSSFSIDVERIKSELAIYVKPLHGSYALTTTRELADRKDYDFSQFNGITNTNANGIRTFDTGQLDTDLVFYPEVLRGSYIQSVERELSAYLELTTPGVRISKFLAGYKSANKLHLDFHTDPHTPYRVHIALDVTPNANWKFKTRDQEYTIHQPADGVPVLIEVANTAHALDIPIGNFRYHIWFQYHTPVSNEILNRLLNN